MSGEDFGILLIRVVTGGFFAAHGSQMLFGWFGGRGIRRVSAGFHDRGFRPAFPFAMAAALTELCGGLGVAFGVLWPLPAVALIGPMTVAVVNVHWPKLWVTEQRSEYPLVLGVVMAGIGLLSTGRISVDHLLGIELPPGPAYAIAFGCTVPIVAAALLSSRNVKRRERVTAAEQLKAHG